MTRHKAPGRFALGNKGKRGPASLTMVHDLFIMHVQYLNARVQGGQFRQHLQGLKRSFRERFRQLL